MMPHRLTSQRHWLASLSLALCLTGATGAADAADFVVRQFTKGAGSNSVAIIDASEDVDVAGPQALTADEEGNLFLLDQLNNRIMRFDPRDGGVDPLVMGLPDELQPTDLVVRRADIMVWDGSIHTLQAPPEQPPAADAPSFRSIEPRVIKLQEVSTRALDDDFALSAFAQMGSQRVGDEDELLNQSTRAIKRKEPRPRARQFVSTRGLGSVAIDVIPDKTEASAHVEVRRFGEFDASALSAFNLRVNGRLGAVEFLEVDYNGHIFMFVESIPDNSTRAVAFITRHSPTGVLEGIYELPLSNVPLSRRFVAVTGTGDVYFLRTARENVDVLGLGFVAMQNVKVLNVRPRHTTGVDQDRHRPDVPDSEGRRRDCLSSA